MAGLTFSKKEAISHGFKITKKYFGVILIISLIFIAFEIISDQLNSRAGSPITKEDITRRYITSMPTDDFYKYLEETGYINRYGVVQDKLQNISDASDLVLSAGLEVDRDKIFNFLDQHRYRLPFPKVIYYLLAIAFWAVGVIMQIGGVKISLLLSRDQKPDVWEIFSNGSYFITYILGSICCGLAIVGGFILLIIPGIILMVAFSMYSYLIVDQNMGPIESLNVSRALTKGVRWQLFWFLGLITLVNFAGLLCLFVGLLFTIPASSIASAYVYDQLIKQSEQEVAK